MEMERRLELVGAWARFNRVWSALGIEPPTLLGFNVADLVPRKRKVEARTSGISKAPSNKVAHKLKASTPLKSPSPLQTPVPLLEPSKVWQVSDVALATEIEVLVAGDAEGHSGSEIEAPTQDGAEVVPMEETEALGQADVVDAPPTEPKAISQVKAEGVRVL
ncbi:hypothetical protein GUJ93_ZPchr0001g31787 [Zizania palustris]|uniref:Uncharacterized protein n=1 Tax=Zizania palustris TaxID=103762 RepID=A0A8J5R6V6_ZIZPA|nr:hypothetical protein GUJ93_ZPchr0001g31787 [Zizania palustris]